MFIHKIKYFNTYSMINISDLNPSEENDWSNWVDGSGFFYYEDILFIATADDSEIDVLFLSENRTLQQQEQAQTIDIPLNFKKIVAKKMRFSTKRITCTEDFQTQDFLVALYEDIFVTVWGCSEISRRNEIIFQLEKIEK